MEEIKSALENTNVPENSVITEDQLTTTTPRKEPMETDMVLLNLFKFLTLDEIKTARFVCKLWNNLTLDSEVLPRISCFSYDGRRRGQDDIQCETFLDESEQGLSIWNQIRFRRIHYKQVSWVNHDLTSTIHTLELLNSSMSWTNILFILSEFNNLRSFSDIQDMYCWDSNTFSEGLENDEDLEDNDSFKSLDQDRLVKLRNLRRIRIHRSQFGDCTTYLKMLNLRCDGLESIQVSTDQSLNPRPSERFYRSLGTLIQKNKTSLQSLWFPYRHIYPVYEVRIADDNHPFREFLTFVTENNWAGRIQPEALADLSIQFPVIHIDETFLKQKLLPFLEAWPCLKNLFLNCVFLESGKESILRDCVPPNITAKFGIWITDNGVNGTVPSMDELLDHFQTLTIQTWRPIWTQIADVISLPDVENAGENSRFRYTKELQYFNKSPGFRSFNINLLTKYFSNLTHLNLVDHNIRGERLHSSEALATIEDTEMQLIVTNLGRLNFLQINANMTFLTDSGLTGLTPSTCKRMHLQSDYEKQEEDEICGKPFSALNRLRHVILRGVGIKVTDVSIYRGFSDMTRLTKLHIYGAQQVTPTARSFMAQKFSTLRGCDIQI